jgi:hypothetical protein
MTCRHDLRRSRESRRQPTTGVIDCYEVETEGAREVADALSGLVREGV